MLLDLLARTQVPARILYIDTGFLFSETLKLRDRLQSRYAQLEFVPVVPGLTAEEQAATHGPELWRQDPDRCCSLRKVEPLREALVDVDVWITGLRRGQGGSRAHLEPVEWDDQYGVVKVNPLVDWTREQVWQHVVDHDVPFNPLHLEGYPSVGCVQCTVPVPGSGPADYSRAGRWQGTGKTECGLHREQPASTSGPFESSPLLSIEPTVLAGNQLTVGRPS